MTKVYSPNNSKKVSVLDLAKQKWSEVYQSMAVHTQNMLPTKTFEARRPFESQNDNALGYRLANYRNVNKSDFDLAIDQMIEACNSMDAETVIGAELSKYLETYRLFDGYKVVNLYQWTFNFICRYKQTDPNAFVVVLPKHPINLLIPSYEYEIPDFGSVMNKKIETITWLVPHNDIINVSDDEFQFKAGAWIVNDKGSLSTYSFRLTKEAVYLIYPKEVNSEIIYEEILYYNLEPSKLDSYTAYVLGGNSVTVSDINGEIFQYYLSDLFGAGEVADILNGQLSDLQICESRFLYPRHWIIKKDCDNIGCDKDIDGIFKVDGIMCGRCQGHGTYHDTTPLGSHILTDADRTDSGDIKAPEGFITPDTAILQHGADRVTFYDDLKMRKLGLLAQNMTNQSGESKRYDLMQKTSLISRVVTDNFRLYDNILYAHAKYIGDNVTPYTILPKDMDVKNSDDIKDELSSAKDSDLPYPAIVELTKRYMLAKFGKSNVNKKKVEFLALYDKLFVYGIEDLKSAVALFGNDITNRDKMVHLIGWQLLDEIDNLVELSNEKISVEFEKLLTPFIPITTNTTLIDTTNSLLPE
jgi:hypothetical protein